MAGSAGAEAQQPSALVHTGTAKADIAGPTSAAVSELRLHEGNEQSNFIPSSITKCTEMNYQL